ncbi:hypothetical protein G7Y89_g2418 [Cudoniella acicularis]|uniref:Uncharacterized protein n=1 Tax=Cudoniella acicularis TaxID=354080 RepID=A0A8H4RV59_9HELO|nr:hypothetical protein G7Y89_g2418 [Cudoniella acicularis]
MWLYAFEGEIGSPSQRYCNFKAATKSRTKTSIHQGVSGSGSNGTYVFPGVTILASFPTPKSVLRSVQIRRFVARSQVLVHLKRQSRP